jgi:hypothetical protein
VDHALAALCLRHPLGPIPIEVRPGLDQGVDVIDQTRRIPGVLGAVQTEEQKPLLGRQARYGGTEEGWRDESLEQALVIQVIAVAHLDEPPVKLDGDVFSRPDKTELVSLAQVMGQLADREVIVRPVSRGNQEEPVESRSGAVV